MVAAEEVVELGAGFREGGGVAEKEGEGPFCCESRSVRASGEENLR